MLTNLIQIVRFTYRKNTKLTSLLNGYAQRFSLYCGQASACVDIGRTKRDYETGLQSIYSMKGAISIAELNAVDTDLWRKRVS